MRLSHLPLLLLASVALGQTAPTPTPTAPPSHGAQAPQRTPANSPITPDTPVITIVGLCDTSPAQPKTATAASGRKVSGCQTAITRAQFDALANALQADMNSATKLQLAAIYPKLLLMQREFHKRGLEKNPVVKEALAFAKLRSEAEETAKLLKEDADNVPEAEIEKYFKDNASAFEQAELQRIVVPKAYPPPTAKDNKQESAKSAGAQEVDADTMKKKAAALQSRAAAGEDFDRLQKEAFESAGMQGPSPGTNLGSLTVNRMPPNHRSVMTLEAGEVSEVIAEPNGYYIYKVVSKSVKPLDQVRSEIKTSLAQQRFADAMQKIEQSAKAELNDAYFPAPAPGAATGARPVGTGGMGFGARRPDVRSRGGSNNRGSVRSTIPPRVVLPAPAATRPALGNPESEAPKN
jgi:parvulin-like peptidyl-prolyl isomerase